MRNVWAAIGMLAVGLFPAAAAAQSVQQPVFRFFGTNTTVTVPDQGQALLGGVDTLRSGSVSRGVPILGKVPGPGRLFRNRAIGREVGSSRNYVRATIIDLNEMDEAILGQAAARQPAGVGYTNVPPHGRAQFLTDNVGRQPRSRRSSSAGGQSHAAVAAPQTEARRLLALGDAALEEGNIELATSYYRAAEYLAENPSAAGAQQNKTAAPLVLKKTNKP